MRLFPIIAIFTAFWMVSCSTVPRERFVSITTKPNFKKQALGLKSSYYSFEIDEKRSFFWPGYAPQPESLNKNNTYRLDLAEEEWEPFGNDSEFQSWKRELVRLYDGDNLLYDASICRKHDLQMERKVVDVSYGLPFFSPEWQQIEKSSPNAGVVLGGCVVDGSRMKTHTWVCPTCKKRRAELVSQLPKS